MNRNYTYSALALHSRNSGENNREVTFLTAEEGLIRATVFGGPKSKLRAHAAPYHQGTLWIYRDPAKEYRKVTDFDVAIWRPGIRELYERTMAAAGIAQTILETQGGGGDHWASALALAASALNGLDTAEPPLCRRILLYFLWNWTGILGQQHSLTHCESCACEVRQDELLWYTRTEGIMRCSSCANERGEDARNLDASQELRDNLPLGPGARNWLRAMEALGSDALGRYSMDTESEREVKPVCTAIIAGILGKRLETWNLL